MVVMAEQAEVESALILLVVEMNLHLSTWWMSTEVGVLFVVGAKFLESDEMVGPSELTGPVELIGPVDLIGPVENVGRVVAEELVGSAGLQLQEKVESLVVGEEMTEQLRARKRPLVCRLVIDMHLLTHQQKYLLLG